MENEIWLPVEVTDGRKEVSNFGRLRNAKTKFILRTRIDRNGYESISFWVDKKCQSFKVHRLVANAFLPNSENKSTVNHKDFNKKNNNALNLEWCTMKENISHYYANGFKGKIGDADVLFIREHINQLGCSELAKKYGVGTNYILNIANGREKRKVHMKQAREKRTSLPQPVKSFTTDGVFIKEYPSISSAAAELKTRIGRIQDVIKGFRRTHKGFVFRLANSKFEIPYKRVAGKAGRSIGVFDLSGDILGSFKMKTHAAKYINTNISTLNNALCGGQKTVKGFIVRFV